jgi:hypothetical protein
MLSFTMEEPEKVAIILFEGPRELAGVTAADSID